MLSTFFLMFFSLYVAQMGDKTQLLTLLLATRIKNHVMLFFAIMTGFAVGVALAVTVGAGISELVPHKILKIISGTVFIILGILLFRRSRQSVKQYKKKHFQHHFLSTALIIFLTDFGDKTQIAIALFSASYHPLLVFSAGILALGVDTFIMIFFSKIILRKLREKVIESLAAILFVLTGLFLYFQ